MSFGGLMQLIAYGSQDQYLRTGGKCKECKRKEIYSDLIITELIRTLIPRTVGGSTIQQGYINDLKQFKMLVT
jgi:hypothetical protein